MPRNTLYKAIAFLSESFPVHGSQCIDRLTYLLAGNRCVPAAFSALNVRRLRKLRRIENICVLCDMNIGDAVIAQAAVSAIRAFLPAARLDYVTKASAACLVEGSPEIDRVYGAYRSSPFPGPVDFEAIDSILAAAPYDLVFNFCPFVSRRNVRFPKRAAVIDFTGLAAEIVRAQANPRKISHLIYRMFSFTWDLLSRVMRPLRPRTCPGVRVTLGAAALERASRFLASAGCDGESPTILFNPDTSSVFTRIPFQMQLSMLSGLAELPVRILLGEGHAQRGIGTALRDSLPERSRAAITVAPASLPIDAYAALADASDVFITGDTGPLHVAAARKYSRDGRHSYRNRTAILSVYAAQPSRLYGYDSTRRAYLASNQDAVARVYDTVSSCRNIAMVNKGRIACEASHFFQSLDIKAILRDAERILAATPRPDFAVSSRASLRSSGSQTRRSTPERER